GADDVEEGALHSGQQVLVRLSAGGGVGAGPPGLELLGELGAHIQAVPAFPLPQVLLSQVRYHLRWKVQAKFGEGLLGPHQGRDVALLRILGADKTAGDASLLDPRLGQRNIGVALEPMVLVPLGLAVPDQMNPDHCAPWCGPSRALPSLCPRRFPPPDPSPAGKSTDRAAGLTDPVW